MSGKHTPFVPPVGDDGLRHWQVAAAVIWRGSDLLLVQNQRRGGRTDWTTPGGVVDPGESPLEALGREVREETGLRVMEWQGPVYRVEVLAPDAGFFLRVETHVALEVQGEIQIDDPDGIVVDAQFVADHQIETLLAGGNTWVVEPLQAFLGDAVDHGETFRYEMLGAGGRDARVRRL